MPLTGNDLKQRDHLVRKRGAVKAKLTVFKNVLNESQDAPDIHKLKAHLERLQNVFATLDKITGDLQDLEPEIDHYVEHASMEENYTDLLTVYYKLQEKAAQLAAAASTSNDPPQSSPNPIAQYQTTFTRLPEQALPKFSGKYEDWLSFQDEFQSTIGRRPGLSDTEKLKYLRSCVSGEPERIVKQFETTDEGYRSAWNLLKQMFEDKGRIRERHVSEILNISPMQRESAQDLNEVINTLELHNSALRSLSENTYSSLMLGIAISKIDKNTRKQWRMSLKENELPTYEELIAYLRRIVISSDEPSINSKEDKSNGQGKIRGNPQHSHHGRGSKPMRNSAITTAKKQVMARTTRQRRKMANTTDAPTSASSLLSSTTSTPFDGTSASVTYPTEGYSFNYSGLANLGGYSLDDLNYTELWVDVWNGTETSNVTERLNATVLPPGGYCDEWESAQHKLFQAANLFFAAAFLVPRSFKASVLALRTFLTAGFMLAALWAGITICALDAMLWCLTLGLLNGIHSLILACRFLPPALSPELAELYLKLFKPYRVSKKHFQELAKEARILKLDPGQTYATEGVTPADERLSILLRGKLKVTCDGTHLHYVRAYQFVDSPEWEATHENLDDVFQVTIRAEESSTYICWTRMKLMRVLRHRPLLKVVLNTLIGKDITSKLYALNEQLAGVAAASENAETNPYKGVARSLSVDAVNTETAGRVRSSTWKQQRRHSNPRSDRSSPARYSHQYWAPVVANHFPPNSPFVPSQNLGYTLLPQGVTFSPPPRLPTATHTPVTRQRSGGGTGGDYTLLPQTPKLERKRSKKTTREVTFETPV